MSICGEEIHHVTIPNLTPTGGRRDRLSLAPPPPATMSLAAIFVFLLVSALQLLDRYLDLARKVSAAPPPHRVLRLPSISSVSSPGSSVNSDWAE